MLGSEPGEADYNPLWEEFFVTWKAGATPVVLTSDNQINALAKAGHTDITLETKADVSFQPGEFGGYRTLSPR